MKKKTVLLVLTLIIANNAFAQVKDIDFKFDIIGIYLPVEYIEALELTKHNPMSWAQCQNYYHTVYVVDINKINALGKYDGSARIYIGDIINFRFENIDGIIFLTDNEHKKYRKIPGDLYKHEYWAEIINNFVGTIILNDLIQSGQIILEKGLVTFPALDNKVFRISWQAYDPRAKENLRFDGVTEYSDLSLEIRHNEYVFYGYSYFSRDIVWTYTGDVTDAFPKKNITHGGVSHPILAVTATGQFVSVNGGELS